MININLCPPAIIYLIFSSIQIVIDVFQGMYNTAFMKTFVTIVITMLLQYLCSIDLTIISWIIVLLPFILMTTIVAILLYTFGLDPSTGKIHIDNKQK